MDSTNLTARVLGENLQGLTQILTERGINVKKVRGGVIVEPPKNSLGVYEIPPEIAEATLLINAEEQGGGMTNTGESVIVCGASGEALTPYYIIKSGHRAVGTHALFAVRDSVATVTVYRHHNSYTITMTLHKIVRDGNTARIESEVLWKGGLEDECPQETIDRFSDAVGAAIEKTSCYHCREPHFVATPEPTAIPESTKRQTAVLTPDLWLSQK